ncbi:MAG: signal peptidase I [Thermoleophilia bacterium]
MLALGASPAASAVRADGVAAYEDYQGQQRCDRPLLFPDAAFAAAKLLAHDDQLNYGAALDYIITEKQVQCQRRGRTGRSAGHRRAGRAGPVAYRRGRGGGGGGRGRRRGVVTAQEPAHGRGPLMRRAVHDAILPGLSAIALAFMVQASVAKPYEIPSPSMVPTIKENDRIIANRLIYRFRAIHRGDIIVFNPPASAIAECRPTKGVPFVKRVIGIPGDKIVIEPYRVLVNGKPFVVKNAVMPNHAPGRPPRASPWCRRGLFVMGDNRPVACGSRSGRSSPPDRQNDPFVATKDVIGQALVRYWPPTRWAFLD